MLGPGAAFGEMSLIDSEARSATAVVTEEGKLLSIQRDDFYNVLVDFPDLRPFVTRHEQSCAYMAAGAAQASGKPQAYCTVPSN